MKHKRRSFILLSLLMAANCMAATHYVVTNNPTAADPFTSWDTAGTNIIDVVNAAMTNTPDRVVWVTNGTYWVTNVITITNSLTIQSLNGRDITILKGFRPTSTNRCFDVQSTASTNIIDGFTITNFQVGGSQPGVCSIYGTIRNCIITGNSRASGGQTCSGPYLNTGSVCSNCIVKGNSAGAACGIYANGSSNVIVVGCLIEGNSASTWGGGIVFYSCNNVSVSNCSIINNRAAQGGGMNVAYGTGPFVFHTCVITGNVIKGISGYEAFGGGIWALPNSSNNLSILNCYITGNASSNSGGGIYGRGFLLRNSVVAMNTALTNGGGLFISTGCVENCTIVNNYAGVSGGGLYINGPAVGTNNIVYFNTAGAANNFTNTTGNTGLSYSCVFPAVEGTRNITNNPALKNLAGGDYRLNNNSPCINKGMNQGWMTGAVDLDGRTRIRYGIVDMGAYERINNGAIYGFH